MLSIMLSTQIDEPVSARKAIRKPLRLWPGIVGAVLVALGWFVVPAVVPRVLGPAMLVGVFGVLVIALWWLIFSRARWYERVGAIILIIVALIVTKRLVHTSIAGGAMGYLLYVLATPVLSLALVAWAVATWRLTNGIRRASLVAAILIVCGGFMVIRTGGLTTEFDNDLHWRWSITPEQQLIAQAANEPAAAPAAPALTSAGVNWPGFRGPDRDGLVRGTRIRSDWSASPPVELWRRPIGPAWSSFAVQGDLIYTQEQRGTEEIVSCYNLNTGKPVWFHRDSARFYESNAGPGPRGTPTLNNGRVYTLGATGIVNALKADSGAVIWSRNAASDTKTKIPGWGFASSPLIVDDVVIVATAGALVAYDIANGNPRWFGPANDSGYSSPHLATIGGVRQILMLNGIGAISLSPTDGKELWRYALPPGPRIVQPAITSDGDILTHDGESSSMRRIAVAQGPSGWTVTERWASDGLNPYFSDFVVHKGHAFGFSGSSIACIDLKDGNLKWKGGSYGQGQLVLLADQDLLLVVSEQGELALVKATPEQFTELGRFPAVKGKTWNHPVLAGDTVLVRNGEEMAAFRLASADR
jgi:outer membrane protein assembly factor BamB